MSSNGVSCSFSSASLSCSSSSSATSSSSCSSSSPSTSQDTHDAYQRFLQRGINELMQHKKYGSAGSTGLQDLREPYFSQIMELNRFMNTTESTNHPRDPRFQDMFLGGWILREYLTPRVLELLQERKWSFLVIQ